MTKFIHMQANDNPILTALYTMNEMLQTVRSTLDFKKYKMLNEMDILNLMGYNDLSISVSETIHILKKSGQNSFRTSTYESNIAILISIFRQMCTWFLSLLFPHHQGLERNNSRPRPVRYSLNR